MKNIIVYFVQVSVSATSYKTFNPWVDGEDSDDDDNNSVVHNNNKKSLSDTKISLVLDGHYLNERISFGEN